MFLTFTWLIRLLLLRRYATTFLCLEVGHIRHVKVARPSALYFTKRKYFSSVTNEDLSQLFVVTNSKCLRESSSRVDCKCSTFKFTSLQLEDEEEGLTSDILQLHKHTPRLTAHHWDKEVPAMDFVNKSQYSLINISPTHNFAKFIQFSCQLWLQLA